MFAKKSLIQQAKSRTSIFKYMTMFFLGASAVMLAVQAFDISTSLNNAVQYISQIVLTADGTSTSATGIVLNGGNGTASFDGATGNGVTIIPSFDVGGENFAGININGSSTVSSGMALMHGAVNGGFLLNAYGNLSLGTAAGYQLVITSAGNVGIGTASPTSKLHVTNTSGSVRLSPTTAQAGISMRSIDSSYDFSIGQRSDAGLIWSQNGDLSLAAGTLITGVSMFFDGSTSNIGINTGSPSQKLEVNGNIKLSNAGWLGNISNQIFLATNGNVGLGATSPQYKLSLGNSGDKIGYYEDSTHYNFIEFYDDTAASDLVMTFAMRKGTSGKGSKRYIFSGGYVGLDTTTPLTSLDVNGSIKIGVDSTIISGGACNGSPGGGAMVYQASHFYVCAGPGGAETWQILH